MTDRKKNRQPHITDYEFYLQKLLFCGCKYQVFVYLCQQNTC